VTAGQFKADSANKLTANNVAPSPFVAVTAIIAVDDEEAFKGTARSMAHCAVNAASTQRVAVKLALHFVLGQTANIAFPATIESVGGGTGNAITRRMNEDAAH